MRFALLLLATAADGASGGRAGGALLAALQKPPGTPSVVVRLRTGADPSDAQSSFIRDSLHEASERLRLAGAAALVLRADEAWVEAVLQEQRSAAGDYPGPCPLIFEPVAPPTDAAAASQLLQRCGADALVVGASTLVKGVLAADVSNADELSPLLVPRAQSQDEWLAAANMPLCLLAADITNKVLESENVPASSGGGVLLGELSAVCTAEHARALRALGLAGVVLDFDVDEWSTAPGSLVRPILSKRSPSFGTIGLSMANSFGSFESEQYWMNKEIKEVKRRKGIQSTEERQAGL